MEEMDADQPFQAAGNMVTKSGERTKHRSQRLRLQTLSVEAIASV
jgi:hypothetical protein